MFVLSDLPKKKNHRLQKGIINDVMVFYSNMTLNSAINYSNMDLEHAILLSFIANWSWNVHFQWPRYVYPHLFYSLETLYKYCKWIVCELLLFADMKVLIYKHYRKKNNTSFSSGGIEINLWFLVWFFRVIRIWRCLW